MVHFFKLRFAKHVRVNSYYKHVDYIIKYFTKDKTLLCYLLRMLKAALISVVQILCRREAAIETDVFHSEKPLYIPQHCRGHYAI